MGIIGIGTVGYIYKQSAKAQFNTQTNNSSSIASNLTSAFNQPITPPQQFHNNKFNYNGLLTSHSLSPTNISMNGNAVNSLIKEYVKS